MTQKLEFSLVADTIKQIKKLMIYSQQLQQYKDYPEVIAELYLKISNRNKDSPDVRITWLDELSRKHSNVRYLFVILLMQNFTDNMQIELYVV